MITVISLVLCIYNANYFLYSSYIDFGLLSCTSILSIFSRYEIINNLMLIMVNHLVMESIALVIKINVTFKERIPPHRPLPQDTKYLLISVCSVS